LARVRDSDASVGKGPTTGDFEATMMMQAYRLTVPFRSTRHGAVTRGVVVCQKCLKVLRPYAKRRSGSGTHGEDFYAHEHPISAIVFVQSNGGHRSHYFMGEKITDDSAAWAVWMGSRLWTLDRMDIDEVVACIRDLLKEGDK